MGTCCFKAQTKSYSNSIEKPLSAFQHNRSTTPENIGKTFRNEQPRGSSNVTSSYPLDSNDKESRFSHGITKFNIKPRDGIQYLQRQELIGSTPIEVAEFLCSRRLFRGRSTLQSGLNKRKIGEYLGYYGGKSEVEIQYHCNLLAHENIL